MADKLTIKGIGRVDGDYDFDIVKLVSSPGDPEYMTYREWHRVKLLTAIRAGEMIEAFRVGDLDAQLAVAVIVLARHGKDVDEDLLWDAPGTAGITFTLAERAEESEPEDPKGGEPHENEPSVSPQRNGGESSSSTSVSPATVPSPTGSPASPRSAISALATSEK